MRAFAAGLALWAGACSGSGAPRVELDVYAAASLRDVCEELGDAYEAARPGTRLRIQFGPSNLLARQIVAARQAELFLSADERQAAIVAEQVPTAGDGPRPWLSNRLVVVRALGDGARPMEGPGDLRMCERLSLAHPEAVPAGRYARAWLESLGLWSELEPRVVPALDVRAALAAVESGAVEAGIVYATDAARSPRVRVVWSVPPAEGPPVRYSLVVLAGPLEREALDLAAFLEGPAARALLERHGFLVP